MECIDLPAPEFAMTHALIAFNVLALIAVIALGLMPFETPADSLHYQTSMQARRAVQGEAPHPVQQAVAPQRLSF